MGTSSYLLCPYFRVAIDYLGCYIIAFSIDTDHAMTGGRVGVSHRPDNTLAIYIQCECIALGYKRNRIGLIQASMTRWL